jgi:peptidoglycan/LPS O-acetylase OafA/YrhL
MRPRYHMLDGFRGLAALLVVLYHLGVVTGQGFVPGGYLAVDFFFALSGFVIEQAYAEPLQNRLSWTRFLQMRFVRLYPLFAVGAFMGSAKAMAELHWAKTVHQSADQVVTSSLLGIALLPSITASSTAPLFPLNVPAWSLLLELIANTAFALILVRSREKRLWMVTLGSAALIGVGAISSGRGMDFGWDAGTIVMGLARVGFSFTLGMLIARHATSGLRRRTPMMLIFLLLMPVLFVLPAAGTALAVRDLVFVLLVSPVILIAGTEMEPPRWCDRWFGMLGDLSYPLYAIHYPLLIASCYIGIKLHLPWVATGCLALSCTLSAAFVLGRYFDRPVRAWLSVRLGLRESAKPQVI